MDRLAEQVVAWHNRHPLAKRISIYDVHTIGVVALPFMRSGRSAASNEPQEPVLTDEISPESLAAAWSEESTIAANTNAAHLDALADQEELPPGAAKPSLLDRLKGLFLRRGRAGAPLQAWPAFSERFVDGVSPRQIANFAKNHGYATRPGDETWPQRVVAIDDALMAKGHAAGGAWPFELYLMSAAIDAGSSRTRVLAGHGRGPLIIGKRCLSPWRVGLLALIVVGLGAAGLALWWPAKHKDDAHAAAPAEPAASAAPVASAPLAAASAPEIPASEPQADPASAPAMEPAASTPLPAASMAEAAPSAASPSPDIRPPLNLPLGPQRPARPQRASEPEASASSPATRQPAGPAPKPAAAASSSGTPLLEVAKPMSPVAAAALGGKPVVALVSPASASKAEAEAVLERMRQMIAPTQLKPEALQAQVFQTPEGWRAAVWPFGSREEAQLINATLVARGMRTKAVNF